MKTTTEILNNQEVHQVNIGGIVYEMVKFAQAEKAMNEYAVQFMNLTKCYNCDGTGTVCNTQCVNCNGQGKVIMLPMITNTGT